MLPGFDPRPWGTQDLSPIYPNHRFEEKIGEAWLSGDDCKVANGPLAGRTLAQLSEEYQRDLVGEAARDAERFPLLLKFLFPHEKLSVQVHPDDEASPARRPTVGENRVLVYRSCETGGTDCVGIEARRYDAATRRIDSSEACRGGSKLDQCLCGGHDLCCRRHGAYAGAGISGGGDAAAVGYDVPSVRLRASAGVASERRHGGGKRKGEVGEGIAPGAAAGCRQQKSACAAGRSALFRGGYVRGEGTLWKPLTTQDDSGRRSVQILVAVDGCGVVEATWHGSGYASRKVMRWLFLRAWAKSACVLSGRWSSCGPMCREGRWLSRKREYKRNIFRS